MNAADAPCKDIGPNSSETQCFLDEFHKQDKELNRVYREIEKALSPDQNGLQASQRLWIQFRDANCASEKALYDGGSAAPMVHAACMEAVTRRRVAELHTMYDWQVVKFGSKP